MKKPRNLQPKNPAFPLEWEDGQSLIQGLFRHGKYKHAAYVKLAIDLGLRFVDTSRITWGDILDSRTGVFQTTEQKTKKKARRTITPELVRFIGDCFQFMNCPEKKEPILVSRRKGKVAIISIQAMNMICQGKWIDLYDLKIEPTNFSQHSFRKTSAMRVYNQHGLIHAKNWLNHNDTRMTERYLLLKDQQILDIDLYS